MGLDITAYSRLAYVGEHEIDPALNEGEPGPWCYYQRHILAYAYDSFPASFRGIPVTAKRDGMLFGGCFVVTDETQTHAFRAGSYSGYNAWRRDLAQRFNPTPRVGHGLHEPDPDKPFYELIWFADNEGVIGSDAARDLLADFRKHEGEYQIPKEDPYGWYGEKYRDWTRACELAADSGLVVFH